jgi:hypothetical protein
MAERSSGYLVSFDVVGYGFWLAYDGRRDQRGLLWLGAIDGSLDSEKDGCPIQDALAERRETEQEQA